MRIRSTALAAILLAAAAPAAWASTYSVPINHSIRIPLAGPAQSVVVGSPSVVDVAVVDSRTVYLSGKTPGDTDVTVIDPLGRVVFRGDVSVAGGASVSVFRGPSPNNAAPSRTDATCAPYCHDLMPNQTPLQPAGAAAPVTTAGMSPAAAMSPLGGVAATIASVQPGGAPNSR